MANACDAQRHISVVQRDPPVRSLLFVQVRSAWVASTEAAQLCCVTGALCGLAASVSASESGLGWAGWFAGPLLTWCLSWGLLAAGRSLEDWLLQFDIEQQTDRAATPGTLQLAALHAAGWWLIVASVLAAVS